MAAQLEVSLNNRVITDSLTSEAVYQLRAAVVRRIGDIDPAIFVMDIDAEDGNDSFNRVANLTDLSTLSSARAAAIARGETVYRVSNVDIDFVDADAARDGMQAVEDAINTLVREYNTFVGAGEPSTSVQKIITGVDKTFLEQLKADLTGVSETITSLESDETTAQQEIDVLKATLDTQKSRIDTLSEARANTIDAFRTELELQSAQYANILGFSALTTGEETTVTGYKTDVDTKVANVSTDYSELAGIIDDEKSLLRTTYADIEAKTNELAQTQAQLVEQRSLYDRTLAAIRELEPTFDG